jgi:hypothetical protein
MNNLFLLILKNLKKTPLIYLLSSEEIFNNIIILKKNNKKKNINPTLPIFEKFDLFYF